MNSVNTTVAKNIRRLREERKLSLDELAKICRVSKSMLAQIERGEGNPTLSTLWKISNGMQVPFDALTVRPKCDYELIRTTEVDPLCEDNGKVRHYSIFPDDENRKFAVYYLEMEPGSFWESEPHLKGTSEFITVFSGSMEIIADQQRFTVHQHESIRFRADVKHSYRNIGSEMVSMHMILHNG